MIPTIADFPSMQSSAKETTEEVLKVLDSKIRQVQSLYSHVSSQVSCSELSAMKQLADCSNATRGGGAGGARDVVLDWRADPFVSLSDLTLNVYTSDQAATINNAMPTPQRQQQQQKEEAPSVYYTHTLLLAYGGRKSNFIAEQIRNQRPSSCRQPTTTSTARQHASIRSNNHRGGKGSIDKLILTESIVGRAYDKVIHRQNSNTSYSSGSSFIESNNHNSNNNNNHNHNHMVEYKVDIHLPPLAAYYLPLLLDYIYGSTTLTYTTNNACAVRYLAHRFDIPNLFTDITNTFISCDLRLVTSSKYISMADELNDYEMRDCAILYLAQRLHKLSINEKGVEILTWLEPRLLRRVLQCDKLVGGNSEEISILVAKYLQLYTNRYTTTTTTTTNNNNNNGKDKINSISSNNVTLPSYNNTQSEAASVLTDEDFYWLTHCQIMPRISPTEAIYYYAYAAMNFPRIMAEVGSGSLTSRCLLACNSSCSADENSKKDGTKKDGSSSNDVVLDSLTSYIEHRGITSDDNPSLPSSTTTQPSLSLMIESYINLDYRYKVQLLECTLVGAKKQLKTKTKRYNRHTAMYEEVQQTEDIMYKKNNLKAVSSALTSPSMSSTNTGVIDNNYVDTAAIVSKAVVLGCGILPANGLYLSSTTRNNNKGDDGNSVTIYEREGIWNGQHVIFLLYPVTLGQYYLQYKLGVRNCTPPTATTTTTTTEKKMAEDNNDGKATRKKKIRILYNSPKIVFGDHATSLNGGGHQYHHHNRGGHHQQQVIIPEGAWEVEQQVNGSGIGMPRSDEIYPAPQFVSRVEQ